MSPDDIAPPSHATTLRESFDRAFADPPRLARTAQEAFLAIRIDSALYAMRLSEIVSVQCDQLLTPFPAVESWLLGVGGFRGTPAPVYDLRAVLSHAGGPPPRWLVLVRAPSLVGLAFDHLDSQFRASATEISLETSREHTHRLLEGTVRSPDGTRFIIRIASVLEAIAQRLHSDTQRRSAES